MVLLPENPLAPLVPVPAPVPAREPMSVLPGPVEVQLMPKLLNDR